MYFSEQDRVRLEDIYERMSLRIKLLNANPASISLPSEEYPHLLPRLQEYAAMSKEELMRLIEADYVFFDGC